MESADRPEDEPLDAYSARLYRPPVPPGVLADLIVIQLPGVQEKPEASQAAETLRKKGRLGRVFSIINAPETHLGLAFSNTIAEIQSPLFIISDHQAKWNKDILERLLKGIDSADMAIGSRQAAGRLQKWRQWITAKRRGFFFGAGVKDPHSPYRIFRTDVFRRFPLQSCGQFVDVELVAKSNFLDSLIFEENLPSADAWPGVIKYHHLRKDLNLLFKKPRFQCQP